MRIFLTKAFARFADRERIEMSVLRGAIRHAETARPDADLGGGVVKLRIARSGSGKSGGYRTIVAFRKGERAIFVYGYGKNERDNIDAAELRAFRELAAWLLKRTDAEMTETVKNKAMQEI